MQIRCTTCMPTRRARAEGRVEAGKRTPGKVRRKDAPVEALERSDAGLLKSPMSSSLSALAGTYKKVVDT